MMSKVVSLNERDIRRQKRKKIFSIIFTIVGALLVILILGALVMGVIYAVNKYSNAEVKPSYYEVVTEDYANINELDVDVNAISLEIKHSGENISLTHHEFIETIVDDDELIIREKRKHWYERVEGKVILTIPENFNFEKVSIEGGAGKVKLTDLNMNKLDLEFGAGTIELNNVVVNGNASIDGGTGTAKIKRGSYNNLDINMDVGRLEMFTKLNGKNIIETGVGSADIKLIGGSDIYTIKVNKGLGDVIIGNYISSDGEVYGRGPVSISMNGGIGNIVLKYVDEEGNLTEDLYK